MNKTTQTPDEKQLDVQKRASAFIKEYGELVKKHKMDFVNYPAFVPDGIADGGFKLIIQSGPVDVQDQPVQSSFVSNGNGGVKEK